MNKNDLPIMLVAVILAVCLNVLPGCALLSPAVTPAESSNQPEPANAMNSTKEPEYFQYWQYWSVHESFFSLRFYELSNYKIDFMQYRPEVKGQTTHYYDLKSNPRLNDPIVQRDCFVEVFYAPNEGLIFRLKNELWGSYVDFPNNVNVSVTAMDVNREKYVFQAKTSGPKSSWDVIDHIIFDKEGFQEIERLLLEEKPLGFSVLIDPENSTFGLRGFSFVFTPRFFKDACGVFN